MKILIVEDEPHAQKELVRIINKVIPHAEIIDYIDSVQDGIEWLSNSETSPDLIFMDVQLSDGVSFDILEKTTVKSPIIFTTAFDEYAIRAFNHHSVDYLLKPIEEKDLKKAMAKYDFFTGGSNMKKPVPIEEIKELITNQTSAYKKRFLIKKGDTITYIRSEEIAYFNSSSENTYLHTFDQKKYLVEYTLGDLDKILDPANFFRVTRKFILNISSIEKVTKYFNNRLLVTVNPPVNESIVIARAKTTEFLKWMEQ